MQKHPVLSAIVVTALLTVVGTVAVTYASDDTPPTAAQVASAQEVSDLLLNELLAALFTEFNETTPANVEHGKRAISLIFNDLNRDMRLIGNAPPLLGGQNDRPTGSFERSAMDNAMTGTAITAVQKVNDTWEYRRSIPLSNKFHQNCVLCHTNFTTDFFTSTNNPGQWVGALVLSVPIKTDDQQ